MSIKIEKKIVSYALASKEEDKKVAAAAAERRETVRMVPSTGRITAP